MDENDISRLIKSALPPEAVPDADLRQKALRKLAGELRSKKAPTEFPAPVLYALAGLLGLAALWTGARLLGGGIGAGNELLLGGTFAVLVLNLGSLPVAAVVIVSVLRRRNHVQI